MTILADRPDAQFLRPADWTFPVPIAYGPGRLADIAGVCARLSIARPLIVTDSGSRALPFVARLGDLLAAGAIPSAVFAGISPNPRDDQIAAGCDAYRDGGHDGIIAIGGGSAMDGAKAIGMTVNSAVPLWDFEYGKPTPDIAPDRRFPPLVTIPTTAGTGAETESTAMVTDVAQAMKFCIAHPGMRPSLALLDPELTLGLPASLTAWTGIDALTHAVEAFTVPGLDPLCDGAALEGLALVARWLPVALAEPGNVAARGGMLVGSCLAGVSFLKGLGLVHAISHMVGAEYDTQHGLTNAIILPVVMRFNLPGLDDKARRMAQAMGLAQTSPEALIAGIGRLLDQAAIPRSLAEIGVPLDCAGRIAEKAIQDSAAATNPRAATVAQIRALTEQAIVRAR